jgi:hypothetical protein
VALFKVIKDLSRLQLLLTDVSERFVILLISDTRPLLPLADTAREKLKQPTVT